MRVPPGLEQGLLGQVLGGVAVAGDRRAQPDQSSAFGLPPEVLAHHPPHRLHFRLPPLRVPALRHIAAGDRNPTLFFEQRRATGARARRESLAGDLRRPARLSRDRLKASRLTPPRARPPGSRSTVAGARRCSSRSRSRRAARERHLARLRRLHEPHGVDRLGALALAVLCHLAKGAAKARAWQNVLTAAYPDVPVRWRSAFGAYAAGVGLNSVLPARIGDPVRLYLMRRRIPGSSYPTLASSLLVEAIFNTLVSAALVAWAIHEGLFPGLDVLPRLPSIDWLWAFHHPDAAAIIVALALAAGIALFAWAARHVEAFGRRLAQGVTICARRASTRAGSWRGSSSSGRCVSPCSPSSSTPSTCRRRCATRC